MPLVRRLRLPAFGCALAVLLCALISSPYANMGLVDDTAYLFMAKHLNATGHIAYNGWGAPMLVCQLYLAEVFIKLFGFSYTTVRMSNLFVAVALAFLLQCTLVRAGINERNATIGTLAFVLAPLYLMLAPTFMTDIVGLFAIVLCLYSCLRALQASTEPSALAWLCFAIVTNAIFGTSRQIAWLGILVMLPSTLWLLRERRRILLPGLAATLLGAIFVFGCMQWLKQQPYIQPEHLLPSAFPLTHTLGNLTLVLLDAPLLLLPIVVFFLPQILQVKTRFLVIFSILLFGYLVLATYPSHVRGLFPLEPMGGSVGEWVNSVGTFGWPMLKGSPPAFLSRTTQALLTIASFGGLAGIFALLLRSREESHDGPDSAVIARKNLSVLLLPFTLAYILLLIPRATALGIKDRYLLAPLFIGLIYLLRLYQQRVQENLPRASVIILAATALFGVTCTHNMFSFYRARVAMAAELVAAGVPDTAVDGGWEHNIGVELRYADALNNPTVVIPAHAYTPLPPSPPGVCPTNSNSFTPQIHAIYGISFDPNACYGLAPFPPVHYSRWLAAPGTLYVVRYLPPPRS